MADALLVCGKCAKRLGDDGKALRKEIKRALKTGRWGEVALEKVGCFSLCPRNGVVVATPRGPEGRRLVVLEAASAVADTVGYLMPPSRVQRG